MGEPEITCTGTVKNATVIEDDCPESISTMYEKRFEQCTEIAILNSLLEVPGASSSNISADHTATGSATSDSITASQPPSKVPELQEETATTSVPVADPSSAAEVTVTTNASTTLKLKLPLMISYYAEAPEQRNCMRGLPIGKIKRFYQKFSVELEIGGTVTLFAGMCREGGDYVFICAMKSPIGDCCASTERNDHASHGGEGHYY
jgi:hypothetical protein